MRFTIDLSLDGCETEEGCREFILEQLNISASHVEIIDDTIDIEMVLAEMFRIICRFPSEHDYRDNKRNVWSQRWSVLSAWLESKCNTS